MKIPIFTYVAAILLMISSASSCNVGSCEGCDQYPVYEYSLQAVEDVNQVFEAIFQDQLGKAYDQPSVEYFENQVSTACAQSKSHPHYCPSDNTVYLDIPFLNHTLNKVQAPGELAVAYIIAHEMGHHIQEQLGIVQSVFLEKDALSKTQYSNLLKKLELQADFLAGVYMHHSYLQGGLVQNLDDLEGAVLTAGILAEDYLFPNMPESQHTHGSMQERITWFLKGVESGDLTQGNTFMDFNL